MRRLASGSLARSRSIQLGSGATCARYSLPFKRTPSYQPDAAYRFRPATPPARRDAALRRASSVTDMTLVAGARRQSPRTGPGPQPAQRFVNIGRSGAAGRRRTLAQPRQPCGTSARPCSKPDAASAQRAAQQRMARSTRQPGSSLFSGRRNSGYASARQAIAAVRPLSSEATRRLNTPKDGRPSSAARADE